MLQRGSESNPSQPQTPKKPNDILSYTIPSSPTVGGIGGAGAGGVAAALMKPSNSITRPRPVTQPPQPTYDLPISPTTPLRRISITSGRSTNSTGSVSQQVHSRDVTSLPEQSSPITTSLISPTKSRSTTPIISDSRPSTPTLSQKQDSVLSVPNVPNTTAITPQSSITTHSAEIVSSDGNKNASQQQPQQQEQQQTSNSIGATASTASAGVEVSDHSLVQLQLQWVNSKNISDVVFVVGNDETEMYALRGLLAMHSTVFKDMFFGDHVVTGTNPVITLADVSSDAWLAVLTFMYTHRFDVTADNVMDALFAAKKYQVMGFEQRCVNWIDQNLSTVNVCQLLEQVYL